MPEHASGRTPILSFVERARPQCPTGQGVGTAAVQRAPGIPVLDVVAAYLVSFFFRRATKPAGTGVTGPKEPGHGAQKVEKQ